MSHNEKHSSLLLRVLYHWHLLNTFVYCKSQFLNEKALTIFLIIKDTKVRAERGVAGHGGGVAMAVGNFYKQIYIRNYPRVEHLQGASVR